jgi:hypothetical protein
MLHEKLKRPEHVGSEQLSDFREQAIPPISIVEVLR